jgi:hypothetical protein
VTEHLEANLPGQIWSTVIGKWGGLDGLHALALALDGHFDIAPRAVADGIMNQLHHLFPSAADSMRVETPKPDGSTMRQRMYVPMVPYAEEDTAEGLAGGEEMTGQDRLRVSITEKDPDLKLLVEQFLRVHPKHQDGITLLLSDEPVDQLAAYRHCTKQTVINRKNRALAALQRFARPP